MGGSVYDKSLEVEIDVLSDYEEVCTLPLVREDMINDEAIARAIAEDDVAGRTAEKLSEMKASTSFDAYDEGVAEATQRSIDSGKREAEERAFDEQRSMSWVAVVLSLTTAQASFVGSLFKWKRKQKQKPRQQSA